MVNGKNGGRELGMAYFKALRDAAPELMKIATLSKSLDLPDEVWHRLCTETDHELRAALICLLTAALAAKGTAAIIGEAEGGWFWLPPWSLWQPVGNEGS
jgi:hypothetical protein